MSPTQELAETQVVPSPLTSAPTSPTRTPTPTPRPGRNTRRNTARVTSPLPPSDIPASLSLSSNEPDTTESQLVNVLTMVDASAAAADSVMLGRLCAAALIP